MAEYYSAELAVKVRRGMTENALKAKANGVRAPFGYYIDGDDRYQIDETLAPVVKEIYSLYLEGKRVKDIAKLMNARGIKNRGYDMNYNSVFRILTNRKYIGEYKFGDILFPDAIPAIIDKETFDDVQQRLKNNKKAPAMHRSEDDYLLTTRLFCGTCGAMMVGEIGTSHTQSKYRYYKCNQAKKHKCDKKAVKKDWIEDLVIEELSDRIYEMQTEENAAVAVVKNQLSEVEKKLNNLAEAIAQGVFSSTTKKLLDDLEEQKSNLEVELFKTQINHPVLTKEQIQFALYSYRKLDLSSQEGKQQLIDGFVNSIFLYDDRFLITFNYKGQSKTVTFEQVNSSSLTSKGSPTRGASVPEFRNGRVFLSLCRTLKYFLALQHLFYNQNFQELKMIFPIILTLIIIAVVIATIALFYKVKQKKYTEYVKCTSSTLAELNAINKKYSFAELTPFIQKQTYDNDVFHNTKKA